MGLSNDFKLGRQRGKPGLRKSLTGALPEAPTLAPRVGSDPDTVSLPTEVKSVGCPDTCWHDTSGHHLVGPRSCSPVDKKWVSYHNFARSPVDMVSSQSVSTQLGVRSTYNMSLYSDKHI